MAIDWNKIEQKWRAKCEPDGMSWGEVTGLLAAIARQRKIVGFDLTELSPGEGPEACAFAAAKLAYKIIGYATTP